MRSVLLKSVLLAGAFLAFAGANASASWNVMEVRVPFAFVVKGQTFPAGRYLVEQENGSTVLVRGEKDNHAAAFMITTPADGQDPAGAKPTLTFTRSENQYRLSNVWESGNEGWSVTGR
jgi:hypothetical protein